MADKGRDKLPVEESSSSTRRHRRETAAADTQFMASARTVARTARAPRRSMTAEEQEENDLFTAQLMSMMGTFEQLAKNPRMQKLLKTKDYRTGSQAETSQHATSRQRQVTEPVERVPTVVIGPVQHVTQAQDPARNGFQGYMPSTCNPMYDNIGVQPGFEIVPGSLGMVGTDLGMAGPSRPYVRPMDLSGGTGVSPNTDIPLLKPPVNDTLTPKGKAKDYKEGGQAVKFEPFFGTTDRMKALIFLQQFDAAFTGGNFTEASKIRKAASFLKGNVLQWWATLLNQGQVPSTWVQFKQIFAPAWLTSAFEVDVMTAWNQLSSVNCESLEEYNQMFWNAFLPVSSFKMVPLTEQVEKYCCGLPKGIRDYCTKTNVMNMTQLIENAKVADNLVRGKAEGKNPSKEQTGKQLPAKTTQPKQPFWKKTFQKQSQRLFLQSKEQKRPFAGKSLEEKRKLMMAGKCFICEENGHIAAKCPQRRPRDAEDKDQPPKKKNLPSASLVPDMLMSGQHHDHYILKDSFIMMHALRRDVDAYVRSCLVCQMVEFDRQKVPGLLQPLPIPDRPWESIAMDFVFDLSRTTTRNDGIWTIICGFSKQAHFIPVRKKIKPEHMVKIFMQNIFKYHGMPQSIVSDRDPRMTSLFWKALFENMGTTLKFSSSFHPQTDEQSKEANSTVLDLLKCYVSEH
ncbi:hypothetical protein L7F22_027354 [Adiantum nelumboides]|nr:hypothetical protein [Adiantum nelumboides]